MNKPTTVVVLLSAVSSFVAGSLLSLAILSIRPAAPPAAPPAQQVTTYLVSQLQDGHFAVDQWTGVHVEVARFATRIAADIHSAELRGETTSAR